MARILVVDDDATVREVVTSYLVRAGYDVTEAADGELALAAAAAEPPDLLVLDLMLPGFDGLEVCRRVQARRPVPVLMLTARDEETDLLVGLAAGADDYVTKPFSLREVVARVQTLLRRVERASELLAAHESAATLIVGDLAISPRERRVLVGDCAVHLTPLEFDLLVELARRPGAIRSREELMSAVWGWSDATGTRTLDSHVKSLRAKIGAERIRTVHGVGYGLEPA